MKLFAKLYMAENGTIMKTEETTRLYEIGKSECETFAQMLRDLKEEFGPTCGRHSPERIYVEVRPGDKYEDHLEELGTTTFHEAKDEA